MITTCTVFLTYNQNHVVPNIISLFEPANAEHAIFILTNQEAHISFDRVICPQRIVKYFFFDKMQIKVDNIFKNVCFKSRLGRQNNFDCEYN